MESVIRTMVSVHPGQCDDDVSVESVSVECEDVRSRRLCSVCAGSRPSWRRWRGR